MFSIVETTTNSMKIAKTISDYLVLNKLSPCVQIVDNILSNYTWDKKPVSDNEILVKIKTRKSNINKVCQSIKKLHNYDNPELISYSIGIESDKYLKWFNESTM